MTIIATNLSMITPKVSPGDFVWIMLIDPVPLQPKAWVKMRIHTPEGCGQVLTENNMAVWPSAPHLHDICPDCIDSWATDWAIWKV